MNHLTLLFQKSPSIELQDHQFYFLHDTDSIYYLADGKADIFFLELNDQSEFEAVKILTEQAIPFSKERFEGAHVHFFIGGSDGELLFPFPLNLQGKYFAVIAPLESTVLKKLSVKEIEEAAKSPEIKNELDKQLNHWDSQMSFLYSAYSLEYVDMQGELGEEIEIPQEHTFMLAGKVTLESKWNFAWMEFIEGSLNLFNIETLIVSKSGIFYPVAKNMWYKSKLPTRVKLHSPEGTPFDGRCWHGLMESQALFLNLFAFHQEKLYEREISKADLKRKSGKTAFRSAVNELQTVLNPKEAFPQYEYKNFLFNTCQLVGKELNLNFQRPPEPNRSPSIEERIHLLCFYSNIYYRKVTLEKDWWKYDIGPLLGFYGEEERPVVLIRRDGAYYLINLREEINTRVIPQIDQHLSCTAYKFYRSFPDKKLSGIDLIKFSAFGILKPLTLILILGLLSSFIMLFFPFANRVIFDLIVPNSDKQLLLEIVLGLILAAVSSQIFLMCREYTLLRLEGLIEQDLEGGIFQRIFNLNLHFIKSFEFGDLLQRVFAIKTIRHKLSGRVLRVLFNSIFSLIFLIPMLYYSIPLTIAGVAVSLLGFLLSVWAIVKNVQYNAEILDIKSKATGMVLQFLSAISKIRVAGTEHYAFAAWEKVFYPGVRLNWLAQKVNIATTAFNYITPSLATLVIYATIIILMGKGYFATLSIGTFLAFTSAFGVFYLAVIDLSGTLLEICNIFPLWKKAAIVYKDPPEQDYSKANPGILSGQVQIDHVSFRYDINAPYVLEDITLHADPGELIGIVGYSGCGKTTLIRLLIGLETPEKGAVYYDNKDLNTLNIKFLRKQLGIVLQTNTLFDGTIRDNIVLEGFHTDEEVTKVLILAGFEEDLKRLPMGLHTILTNEGNNFSQGQKQRILIARALISKPRILLLDEATNALDSKTQSIIHQNLDRMHVTRLVIAHNLSTIRYADRIYVIDKGKIADSGTFTELAGRPGIFSDLVKKQKLSV